MNCPTCKAENPQDANFCSNCGAAISDPLAIENMRAGVRQQIDGFVEKHLRELKLLEAETLHRVTDGAVKRLTIFGSVLALFFGFLGFLGVKELNIAEELSTQTRNVREETVAVRDEARDKLDQVKEIAAEVSKWESKYSDAAQSAKDAETKFDAKVEELKEGEDRLETALNKAAERLADLEERTNLSINAKYKISVHVPPGDSKVEPFLLRLRETLGIKGFVVRAEDTLWLSVDRNEILYYYHGDEERAMEIQKVLLDKMSLRAAVRKNDVPSRNYEIQIKLSQVPQTGGF